jgi:hypothetical protein
MANRQRWHLAAARRPWPSTGPALAAVPAVSLAWAAGWDGASQPSQGNPSPPWCCGPMAASPWPAPSWQRAAMGTGLSCARPAAASSKSRAAAGRLRRPTRIIARRHRCKDLSGGTMCLSSRLLDWILLASPWPVPKPALRKHKPTSEVRRFRNSGNRPVCVPLPPHPPPDLENSYIESTSEVSECM